MGSWTLSDFKAIKGDREMGINSLPVLVGPDRAAQVACPTMAAPQLAAIALLISWGHVATGIVVLLLIDQLVMTRRLLRAPVADAVWYSDFGVSLLVLDMATIAGRRPRFLCGVASAPTLFD
jgi:chlorophyll/bacteriochlorophyll a synthase